MWALGGSSSPSAAFPGSPRERLLTGRARVEAAGPRLQRKVVQRGFPGELRPATRSRAPARPPAGPPGRGCRRAGPEGSVGGRARAGPPPSLCASRDAREWAWAGPARRREAARAPAQSGAASGEPGSGPGASRPPARPPLPRGARPSPLLPSRWKVSRISSQRPLRFQHGGADGGGSRLQRGFLQGTGRGAAGAGAGHRERGQGTPGTPGAEAWRRAAAGDSGSALLASALGAV